MADLIYRQAAIDALDGEINIAGRVNAQAVIDYVSMVKDRLERLPSVEPELDEWCTDCKEYDQERHCCPRWNRVIRETLKDSQPEPLTDREQRIFLSAMERERKVCRQVDEEWRNLREPYEDSLVHVCNEIERKVKGALWT